MMSMEEWKEYRLGELCDTISDTYKKGAKEVVLINTSDVLDGKCLNHQKVANENLKGQFKKTFQYNDILYSEIRPANKRFAFVDFEATDYIASTKLMVLRHNEKITPQYLYYILKSQNVIDELQMLAESRSGTFPQITFSELSNLKVLLPNIKTQNRIISILSSLDDKIEVNRRINEQLEELAQALFKSWLQKAKEKRTIGDMCNNILDYSKCSYDEVVLVNSSDVTRGIFEHHNYSPNNELKGHFKKRFRMYDVLYSEIRPRNQHYAYCLFDPDKYIASTRLMILRNKENIVSSSILYSYILLNSVQEEFTLKTETRSGTFPQGKFEDMAQITLPYHPIEQQTEMTDFLNAVYDKMWTNQQEITHLTTLRDTLLPKLMSGEIDVNEVEL